MAEQKRTTRQPASSQRRRSAQNTRSNRNARNTRSGQRSRRARRPQKSFWDTLRGLMPKKAEFKPDAEGSGALKVLHMTRLQRLRLLKWVLYIAVLILALVIQDVIMSRITIFGATTDLVVCVILLITVIEGTEVGSMFVLLTSLFYYFSGSSPGPYTVAILTVLGMGATLFRQALLHRSPSSIVVCAGGAQILYELATFASGLVLGLTHWGRLGVFVFTGVLSALVMIPLYPLIHRIGLIGGNTWKE